MDVIEKYKERAGLDPDLEVIYFPKLEAVLVPRERMLKILKQLGYEQINEEKEAAEALTPSDLSDAPMDARIGLSYLKGELQELEEDARQLRLSLRRSNTDYNLLRDSVLRERGNWRREKSNLLEEISALAPKSDEWVGDVDELD